MTETTEPQTEARPDETTDTGPTDSPLQPLTIDDVATEAQLRQWTEGKLARAPSGLVYLIRQINFERHAMAGGLPPNLLSVVLEGEEGFKRLFEEMSERGDVPPEQIEAENKPLLDYLDNVVVSSLLKPSVTAEDLGRPGDLDSESIIPPIDYQWLVSVAMRSTDYDAEGRRLWGVEPISRFRLFRHFHGCAPDCPGCNGVQLALAAGVGE